MAVQLDQPLPTALVGKAGFNLEFVPTAYFGKTFIVDEGTSSPRHDPGRIIIQPDFPELNDAWPFLWYENEYVVDTVTAFILAATAADAETRQEEVRK